MTNTLKYYKQLAEAGISDKQSEAHIKVVSEIIEDSMSALATKYDLQEHDAATKNDIQVFRNETRQTFVEVGSEMKELAAELRAEMRQLAIELRTEMKELEYRLTLKLVFITAGMITFSIGATTTILTIVMKVLLRH